MEREHMEELEKTSETRTERQETRAESLVVPHLLWSLNSLGTLYSIPLVVSIVLADE
jgi:hypothetical protein